MRRIVVLLAVIASSLAWASAVDAQDDSVVSRLVVLTNQERRSRGIRELSAHTALTATSCDWNKQISAERLDHDPQLREHIAAVIPHVVAWAENLGTGPTAEGIHDAWMKSSQHNVHILDPKLELVGICADRNAKNQIVVTQRFATSRPPANQTTTPPPAPTSPRPTAPRSAPTTTSPTTAAPAVVAPPVTEPPTTLPALATTEAPTTTTTEAPAVPQQVALDASRVSAPRRGINPVLLAAVLLAALVLLSIGVLALTRSRRHH